MPGLGSRILPPVAVKPSVEVAPLDREVLEARVRELEAQVDAAKIRLRQAERRFALGEGQYKAELMTQGDYSDLKDAVPLAQAELARVTAELDVERILLRRAIEASPQTSVTVVAVGEVKQPGVYLLPLNSTLLDLLVKAGGPTENADQAHATLMRTAAEGPAVQEVDLSGWKAGTPGLTGFGGMTSLHSQLRPGDVLVVPAKGTTGG